jgi:uncharacterized membrane protein YbhN (UPF0104 family)
MGSGHNVTGSESESDGDNGRASTPGRGTRWFSWLFGLALLAAVTFGALHYAEGDELVRITEKAEPGWLGAALVLQSLTYLAQGETWRVVTRAAGVAIPLHVAFKLSLAKLFIDQALPSAGISGTLVLARTLEERGIARPVVMAVVVVDTVSYYAAVVPALAVAVLITIVAGHANALVVAAALAFVAFSGALTTATLVLSGRQDFGPHWLPRIPVLTQALTFLRQADPLLARSERLILRSAVFQLAIVLIDTTTVWVLIRSLGETASPTGVFVSFMLSTLLRTISFVPGGLGAFEAASVWTLKAAGVPLAVALAATLLFRGLSFWLPMLPGLLFSRGSRKAT